MNWENCLNRLLGTDEPVEFKKQPVEVHQDFRKSTEVSFDEGIYGIYVTLIKKNRKMSNM